jgi:fibronectin-binding autotransporter adhesin
VSSLAATTGGSLPAQINNSNATAGNDSTFTYAGTAANPSTFPGTLSDNSLNSGGKLNLVVASGTLTLSNTATSTANGAATYAGATTVNSGATLILAAAGAVTNPAINPNGGNIQNNGLLIANDTLDTNTITAGNISGSGTTTVTSTTSLTVNNVNQAGGVVNNGVLTVLGAGPSVVGPISGEGTLQLAGPLQLATSSGLSTLSTLALAGAGTLDINNNHVIINYGITGNGDPISQIQAMLLTGYAGGAWNGAGGIMSTAASLNSNHYGLGYADSADTGNPAGLASGTIEIEIHASGRHEPRRRRQRRRLRYPGREFQ